MEVLESVSLQVCLLLILFLDEFYYGLWPSESEWITSVGSTFFTPYSYNQCYRSLQNKFLRLAYDYFINNDNKTIAYDSNSFMSEIENSILKDYLGSVSESGIAKISIDDLLDISMEDENALFPHLDCSGLGFSEAVASIGTILILMHFRPWIVLDIRWWILI